MFLDPNSTLKLGSDVWKPSFGELKNNSTESQLPGSCYKDISRGDKNVSAMSFFIINFLLVVGQRRNIRPH